MKIVIDIPESIYETIEEDQFISRYQLAVLQSQIRKGVPLPKGHGRLIDADEYKEHLYACETNGRPLHIMELDERLATVDETPTIIEPYKVESEDKE